ICFASAELAAYDTTIRSADTARYALTFSSSALLRLAAANTVIVSAAARAGSAAAKAMSRAWANLMFLVHRDHDVGRLDDRVGGSAGLETQPLGRDLGDDGRDL